MGGRGPVARGRGCSWAPGAGSSSRRWGARLDEARPHRAWRAATLLELRRGREPPRPLGCRPGTVKVAPPRAPSAASATRCGAATGRRCWLRDRARRHRARAPHRPARRAGTGPPTPDLAGRDAGARLGRRAARRPPRALRLPPPRAWSSPSRSRWFVALGAVLAAFAGRPGPRSVRLLGIGAVAGSSAVGPASPTLRAGARAAPRPGARRSPGAGARRPRLPGRDRFAALRRAGRRVLQRPRGGPAAGLAWSTWGPARACPSRTAGTGALLTEPRAGDSDLIRQEAA